MKNILRLGIFSGDALSETENEYVDTPAPNGGSQTYKKGYTITLTGLDYGTYDFWVVANPTEANEAYKSCQSLDALKEIIEGGDSYQTAFAEKANQLVKVGNKSATFNLYDCRFSNPDPVNTVGCTGGTESAGGYSETIERWRICV